MQHKVRSSKVKSTLAVVLVVSGLWAVSYTNVAAAPAGHPVEIQLNASILLPLGMSIPDGLPQIRDLDLLAGWLWLWNTDAGRPMAEYIRDNNILVEYWNGSVNSAPVVPVTVRGRKQVRSMNKIQISNRTPQTHDPAILAGMLAHEGYHTQLPFGPNQWPGTIYEEYHAYKLQQRVYTELYDHGWTGDQVYRVPVDPNPFDTDDRDSLAEYGLQLGQAYANCRLYPWVN